MKNANIQEPKNIKTKSLIRKSERQEMLKKYFKLSDVHSDTFPHRTFKKLSIFDNTVTTYTTASSSSSQ